MASGRLQGTLVCFTVVVSALADAADKPARGIVELDGEIRGLLERRFTSDEEETRLGKLIEHASQRFPREPSTLYWQARRLDREKRTPEAVRLLEESLRMPSEVGEDFASRAHSDAAVLLGAIRLEESKPSEAVRLANLAIQNQPSNAAGYRLLVDASLADGSLIKVRPVLSEAAKRYGVQEPEFLELYCRFLVRMGLWRELETAVSEALGRDPASPVAQHFRARLLERDGKAHQAQTHDVLAVMNGCNRLESVRESADRLARTIPIPVPGEPVPPNLAVAGDLLARCESRLAHGIELDRDELTLARQSLAGAGDTPEEKLIHAHLQATLNLLENNTKAARNNWEAIIQQWPTFVPALCRLAQVLEVEPDEASRRRAAQLYQRARTIQPWHPFVRQYDRLGLTLQSTESGVLILSIEKASPLATIGCKAGDILVGIDRQRLSKQSPIERLRTVRTFSGGTITLAGPDGLERRLETPILLLE